MEVEQIAVFLENESGRLAEITRILAEHNINIRALSLADTADYGILRLIVDQAEEAKTALRAGGFTVNKNKVVAVEVPDRAGGLAGVLHELNQAALNVEYMYAFVNRKGGNAILIFRFDDMEKAGVLLQSKGFRLIPGEEIYQN